jgi:hypothetical protein
MKKIVMTMALVLSASSAFADQCAYITKDQAAKAVTTLLSAQSIKTLCEPCGESKAVAVKDVKEITVRTTSVENLVEITLDGKGIDLAYTYVNGLNLALTSSCPAQGVSPSLRK